MKPSIALMALTAFMTTPEMIEAQKTHCTQLGYTPGTAEHAMCVERAVKTQQNVQFSWLAFLTLAFVLIGWVTLLKLRDH